MFVDLSVLFDPEEIAREPQQRRSLEKQEAIFKAAAELFVEKGFSGTSTNEIAAKAGVSIGILYFQFEDKRQILLSLLAKQISGYAHLGPVDGAAVVSSPLKYLIEQMSLAYPYNDVFYAISVAIRELTIIDPHFRQRFGLLQTKVYERFIQIIEVGQAADMVHPEMVIKDTASIVTNYAFNFYSLLPNPSKTDEATYWRRHHLACEMMCRIIFRYEHCRHPVPAD